VDEQTLPVGEVAHLRQTGVVRKIGRVRLGDSVLAPALLHPTDDGGLHFGPLLVDQGDHRAIHAPLDHRRPLRRRRPLAFQVRDRRVFHCRQRPPGAFGVSPDGVLTHKDTPAERQFLRRLGEGHATP